MVISDTAHGNWMPWHSMHLFGLACLVVAGCTVPPPPPPPTPIQGQRTYTQPADQSFQKLVSALEATGFTVQSADPASGTVIAVQQPLRDPSWATCPQKVMVRDSQGNSHRRRPANPKEALATVQATVTGDASTSSVQLGGAFEKEFLNNYRAQTFRVKCRSNGTLETRLLDAI